MDATAPSGNGLMPLAMVETGATARIMEVNAGRGLEARLAAMGLLPGTEIEVVRNMGRGAFVVAVKESRLVLGRGMAHKIMVS